MAKTREEKRKEVERLESALKRAKSWVLIDYYGLKVKEINALRKLAKIAAGQYLVTKKTLLKLILSKIGLKDVDIDRITGGIGLILGYQDETWPARTAVQFLKEHEKMKISGGFFAGGFIGPEEIKILAALPDRDELLRRLVWTVKSLMVGLVSVCQGNLRNLVYAFNVITNKKQ